MTTKTTPTRTVTLDWESCLAVLDAGFMRPWVDDRGMPVRDPLPDILDAGLSEWEVFRHNRERLSADDVDLTVRVATEPYLHLLDVAEVEGKTVDEVATLVIRRGLVWSLAKEVSRQRLIVLGMEAQAEAAG